MKPKDIIPARLPALLRAERELEQVLAAVRRHIDALANDKPLPGPLDDEQPKDATRH